MINPDEKFIVYQVKVSGSWRECTGREAYEQSKGKAETRRLAILPDYHITARTWFGRFGGMYRAELREIESGNVVFEIEGVTGTLDGWSYTMRDTMHDKLPDLFPRSYGSPTIYFREVCNVPYDHREVPRRRDL